MITAFRRIMTSLVMKFARHACVFLQEAGLGNCWYDDNSGHLPKGFVQGDCLCYDAADCLTHNSGCASTAAPQEAAHQVYKYLHRTVC